MPMMLSTVSPTCEKPHIEELSIAQNIIYTAHNGHVKTPKHVLLPSAVHHMTRSAQIVTLLNRFGHGMSMSLVQEMDTALAERQLELAGTGNVPLPSNIDALTSVVLATDNNDILEDTPTGANTTHCTNSILVQRPLPSVAALPSNQPHAARTYTAHAQPLHPYSTDGSTSTLCVFTPTRTRPILC